MNTKKYFAMVLIATLSFLVACGYAEHSTAEQSLSIQTANFQEAFVERVIDGDTIVIEGGLPCALHRN